MQGWIEALRISPSFHSNAEVSRVRREKSFFSGTDVLDKVLHSLLTLRFDSLCPSVTRVFVGGVEATFRPAKENFLAKRFDSPVELLIFVQIVISNKKVFSSRSSFNFYFSSFILFYFIFFYFVVICFWFCSLLFVTIRFGSARFGTVWWGSFRFEFYENHAVNHQASLLLSLLLTSRDSSSTLFGSSTNNFTKSDISAHITAINQNNHPTPIWSINCGSILVIMYTRSQLVIVSMQRIVK